MYLSHRNVMGVYISGSLQEGKVFQMTVVRKIIKVHEN